MAAWLCVFFFRHGMAAGARRLRGRSVFRGLRFAGGWAVLVAGLRQANDGRKENYCENLDLHGRLVGKVFPAECLRLRHRAL